MKKKKAWQVYLSVFIDDAARYIVAAKFYDRQKVDSHPSTFISEKICAEAFLHTQEREVDKTGYISFQGRKYEVGMKLTGRKIEVYFDPTIRSCSFSH